MAHPAQTLQDARHRNLKERIAGDLKEARDRTEELLAPIDDERLTTQYDQLMSPPVWDYTHIGVFEELWLVQGLSGAPPIDEGLMQTYNALDTPRRVRGRVQLMSRARTVPYLAQVRERTLALLEEVDLEGHDRLLERGFVYDLVMQHEHQHDETILQTIQLMPGGYLAELPRLPEAPVAGGGMVRVPGGRYPIGSDAHEPYDNEHPRHDVELPGFEIDRFPVTNGDYLAFMADGGYTRRELWSRDGWDWIMTFGTEAPEYWFRERARASAAPPSSAGQEWLVRRYGHELPVDPRLPVTHVCYFEAEAYARWAGKRLPTEFEWEVAAAWDPRSGTSRRFPWGDQPPGPEVANLDLGAGGSLPGGREPPGLRADGGRRLGVDGQRLPSLPGLPGLSLRRVLGALLRGALQGAPGRFLGDAAAGGQEHLPELGLADQAPDLRRLPLRQGPRVVDAGCAHADHPHARRGRAPGDGRPGPPRVDQEPQGAALPLLLRRPRLGALRADHGAAGVLPHAG
jgi:iron(II)-dependent oxidoreductase